MWMLPVLGLGRTSFPADSVHVSYLLTFNYLKIMIIILIMAIIIIIFVVAASTKTVEEEKEQVKQSMSKMESSAASAQALYKKRIEYLHSQYGYPDKTMKLWESYNHNSIIMVWMKAGRIFIAGRDLLINDILGFELVDNSTVKKGSVFYETKTNAGNMVKRAVIGGILLGGVGAAIGGVTAKRKTITNQQNDEIIHNYTLIININNISNPVINYYLGDNATRAREVVGLLNALVK